MFEYIIYFLLSIFSLFIILLIPLLYIYYKWTFIEKKKIETKLSNFNSIQINSFDNYKILNPYQVNGNYYKAQIHAHTNKSDGKLSPQKVVQLYQEHNYNFLAITDHDQITKYNLPDNNNLITIKGEEMTYPNPFWPCGEHMGRLFVNNQLQHGTIQERIKQTVNENGIVIINHPSSLSNIGTQQWQIDQLTEINELFLIEVVNHYSSTEKNLQYWHALLKHFGPQNPIWAVGGDDSHSKDTIDNVFLMVKINQFNKKSFKNALINGNLYISQGPLVQFGYDKNGVFAKAKKTSEIKFIDADFNILKKKKDTITSYQPEGKEGFIRIEIKELKNGKKAWSQPFWIEKSDSLN